jgi:pimeloyl-ACP methyl ester carboxylesterase
VEKVTFAAGPNELSGILTLPAGEGPHPAIVLISGSVNLSTGTRSGASSGYFREHARALAEHGWAVLRYDPPGVGQSTGEAGFESLDMRAEEAAAALRHLQTHPDIQSDQVGLWGISQGGWVIAMAAARYPKDVAFVISVSGSGISVAEQQVYSIRAQSEAAGMAEDDVSKAVLMGRLLIDWQLETPIYQDANEADAQALGEGAWSKFMALVYEPADISPAEGLAQGIEVLESIQDEPWAEFIYLKELYLPGLRSIPPEQAEAVKAQVGPTLLEDPRGYWTRVHCPVLAFFGEEDLLQPSKVSAALYEEYLTAAGNQDYHVVVIPGEGHSIGLWTPAYKQALLEWLATTRDSWYP